MSTNVLMLPPDFPYRELQAVSAILEHADVFVPGYIPGATELYDPDAFIYQSWVERAETVVLPDRNIVSRLASVARGEKIDAHRRRAAAVLAFAQCLDIQIEPSVAFHELAPNHGNEIALDELAWFRIADKGNPYEWLAVALGHSDRIDSTAAPLPIGGLDLEKPLGRWRRNYVITLKIAELGLSDLRALDRVLALFRWMFEDFMLAGPAAMLSCVYFAPNSPPRQGMFKQLYSADRGLSVTGVKNAAWDVTHLSDFARRVDEGRANTKRRYLFATFDEALKAVARLVVSTDDSSASEEEILASSLQQWWPPKDARSIAETWFGYVRRPRSPEWFQSQAARPNRIDELITQGEESLRCYNSRN
ncbi:hypothetical protein [Burkholderia gladioli]|uniref:hypothetical protein n=1 Tax=Burkholderia gladioli TaxID=28095 RepID=UPI0013F61DD3|nr:hypothetical protein [Burkholderia gladioli]